VILSWIVDRVRNSQIGLGAYEVAHKHYDLGNDLFKAMLDRDTMTYTCGYWKDAQTLEQAQKAKIDLCWISGVDGAISRTTPQLTMELVW
jgi:cyclopropane-fatty-acyl-phospholipid synthase